MNKMYQTTKQLNFWHGGSSNRSNPVAAFSSTQINVEKYFHYSYILETKFKWCFNGSLFLVEYSTVFTQTSNIYTHASSNACTYGHGQIWRPSEVITYISFPCTSFVVMIWSYLLLIDYSKFQIAYCRTSYYTVFVYKIISYAPVLSFDRGCYFSIEYCLLLTSIWFNCKIFLFFPILPQLLLTDFFWNCNFCSGGCR